MTAGAVAQAPSPRATPSPVSTPHLATAQPTASSAPTPIRIDQGTDWGTPDHGLRLTIEMSNSFKLGSEMPFAVFVGNFSSEILRYDNCVSSLQAARSFSLYDRKGRVIKKNTGLAYPIGCDGLRKVGPGGFDTIVWGSIDRDWVLSAGTYTFKVSTSIGLRDEKPIANVSASKTFTIAKGP
jgi:hypothetical protein